MSAFPSPVIHPIRRTTVKRFGHQRRPSGKTPCLLLAALTVACSDGAAGPGGTDGAAAGNNKSAALPAARPVSFVKLEEVSEIYSQPWASVAEFNLIDSTRATVDRKGWTVTADSAAADNPASHAIDGNPGTLWHTPWEGDGPPPPHALVINLGRPVRVSGFSYLSRQDNIRNGTIARYRFHVSADGVDWGQPVSTGDFSNMGPPTLEKVVVFAQQTANHAPSVTPPPSQDSALGQPVSLAVVASDVDLDVLSYEASGLPAGLGISPKSGLISGTPIAPGTYSPTVSATDHKGLRGTAAFKWVVRVPAPAVDASAVTPGQVRYVKLEELSEVNGQVWASMAEFNLVDAGGKNLPRAGWTASADSSETIDNPGNAIDGNPASLWHSQWDGASPPPPHSFIVDLGAPAVVRGFRYLPRQDRVSNGTIARFRFYTSNDGLQWGKPVVEGDFAAMGPTNAEKTVFLK